MNHSCWWGNLNDGIRRPEFLQPDQLLSSERVAEMIAGVARPLEIIGDGRAPCIAQTGFCFSRIPHILVLAMDRKWLEMGMASQYVGGLILGPDLSDYERDRLAKPVLDLRKARRMLLSAPHSSHSRRTYGRTVAIAAPRGSRPSAVIHRTAVDRGQRRIGHGVEIGAFAVIKANTIIGEGTRIAEHCTIGGEGIFFKEIAGRFRTCPTSAAYGSDADA